MLRLQGFKLTFTSFLLFTLLYQSPPVFAETVWLNTRSGVYHCEGTRWFGNTKRGRYVDEVQALLGGQRPARGSYCSPSARQAATKQLNQQFSGSNLAGTAADNTVWVNTSSRVYHCPGSRWFGKTKRGKYLPEQDALMSGNRPAHGARCD